MDTTAVVFDSPRQLSLRSLALPALAAGEVLVEMEWSGISTGTERLLWRGEMPQFPGLGYPLVPGYESIGRVTAVSDEASHLLDRQVFVPGARCYGEIRGLFGGSASKVVVDASRVVPIDESLGQQGVLLALAATAYHAVSPENASLPDLIVGHGVLGRLLARLAVMAGDEPPVVWETNPTRHAGARGYQVTSPEDDSRRDYQSIYDVSGDASLLDELIGRLAPQGELVLAGFYSAPISFAFPPAFMKEAKLRVAAEWQPEDLILVRELIEEGRLDLDGLITHHNPASAATSAYQTAFEDSDCLKMVLDWRN